MKNIFLPRDHRHCSQISGLWWLVSLFFVVKNNERKKYTKNEPQNLFFFRYNVSELVIPLRGKKYSTVWHFEIRDLGWKGYRLGIDRFFGSGDSREFSVPQFTAAEESRAISWETILFSLEGLRNIAALFLKEVDRRFFSLSGRTETTSPTIYHGHSLFYMYFIYINFVGGERVSVKACSKFVTPQLFRFHAEKENSYKFYMKRKIYVGIAKKKTLKKSWKKHYYNRVLVQPEEKVYKYYSKKKWRWKRKVK